ncbi:MAG: cation:proton antiporter [Granulosicoccus sp.]|nr:cation:proton antiporter [Granulosicoccus sp.]
MNNPMIAIAGMAALGGLAQWLAWRFKLPSILFLLCAGIFVGPVLGIFNPDALLGDLLFPVVSIAVAIILFEGGLTLKISDIRDHGSVVTRLITVGVLITWLLLSATVHFLFDMPWPLALVFGSITVVSGPTVVKPLLRAVRPSDKVGHILHWEGILIDPVGVFLALLVFDFVMLDMPGNGFTHIALVLSKLIIIGISVGVGAGYATAYVLRRYLVPDYLVNVLTLTTVVCAFVFAESIQHESGLLAVTIMGVWLANSPGLHVEEILHFKEDLSILLISTLFILLASRVDIGVIPEYGWQIVLLLIIAQLIIRPLNAMICTLRSELSAGERFFIGWISPRGIVAAAVSSVFFLRLQEVGMPMSELLVPLTFSLIIGTVVFQSLTAKIVADKLGISNPEPNGVLFFGANEIALTLAEALKPYPVNVMLSDTSWRNVRLARQAGFEAYHGNPTSGHASENLDLQGIGKLIAVSSNRDTNALAGMHFRQEFGANAVFTLEGASEEAQYERFDTANRNRANPLFDATLSHSGLARKLREGTIRHIPIKATEAEQQRPADGDESSAEPPSDQDSSQASEIIENNISRQNTAKNVALKVSNAVNKNKQDKGSDHAEQKQQSKDTQPHSEQNTNDSTDTKTAEVEPPALYDDDDLKLFAIDKDGRLHIYGAGEKISLKTGWHLVVLTSESVS